MASNHQPHSIFIVLGPSYPCTIFFMFKVVDIWNMKIWPGFLQEPKDTGMKPMRAERSGSQSLHGKVQIRILIYYFESIKTTKSKKLDCVRERTEITKDSSSCCIASRTSCRSIQITKSRFFFDWVFFNIPRGTWVLRNKVQILSFSRSQ